MNRLIHPGSDSSMKSSSIVIVIGPNPSSHFLDLRRMVLGVQSQISIRELVVSPSSNHEPLSSRERLRVNISCFFSPASYSHALITRVLSRWPGLGSITRPLTQAYNQIGWSLSNGTGTGPSRHDIFLWAVWKNVNKVPHTFILLNLKVIMVPR